MEPSDVDPSIAALERSLALNRARQRDLRDEEAAICSQLQELRSSAKQAAKDAAEAHHVLVDWTGTFEWDATVADLLKLQFGHDSFRPLQREVINATLSRRDTFAILPTGSGKSVKSATQTHALSLRLPHTARVLIGELQRFSPMQLLFQLPGLLSPSGLTVVVSPLVSLMVDQVASLSQRGVRCALLAADLTDRTQSTEVHHQIEDPATSGLRFLYVTPERIAKSKMLVSKLQKAYHGKMLLRFAIDEAHCACAQGHDFRPDYLSLGTLRTTFPEVPILALTATASESVRADVERSLQMDHLSARFRGHFDRPNIKYSVRKKLDEAALLDEMAALALRDFPSQAGIVYTLSRADAEKVADGLQRRGVRCAPYHAGVDALSRQSMQAAWQSGRMQIVVATIAFGMGIDKPDVRFVFHHSMSKSLEAYYQESGRAGRDGKPAEAIAWWSPSDFYRLASLACDTSDRAAAWRALVGSGRFCEMRHCCRRECLASLFGQSLPARVGAVSLGQCCDVCAAASAEAATPSASIAHRSTLEEMDVSPLAIDALRCLAELNDAAAAEGVTDGGAAPAKLTALKLVEKLASRLRHADAKLSREALEHLVLRLVLADAVRVHFAFTAYSILTYLFTRPSLASAVLGDPGATAHSAGLHALACSLPSTLLPMAKAAKANKGGGKRKAAAASDVPPQSRKRVLPESDGSDFEVEQPMKQTGRDAAGGMPAGRGRIASAGVEVVIIDDDEE